MLIFTHLSLFLFLNLFFKISNSFIPLSHNSLFLSRCKNLDSLPRLTVTQKMQKIHDINSKIPIRKYSADSPEVRMMLNEIKLRSQFSGDSQNPGDFRGSRAKKSEPENDRIAKCTAKYLLLSPRKVNKILRKIRKMPVLLALGYLSQFGSHPYYLAIYKCIKSSLFNIFFKLNKASQENLNNDNNNNNNNNSNNNINNSNNNSNNNNNNNNNNDNSNNNNNDNNNNSNNNSNNNTKDTQFINNLLNDNLYGKEKLNIKFKMLYVTRGGYIKKPFFRAKGRCDIIRKPKSHINVVLSY